MGKRMAKIASDNLIVQISKLVKNDEPETTGFTDKEVSLLEEHLQTLVNEFAGEGYMVEVTLVKE